MSEQTAIAPLTKVTLSLQAKASDPSPSNDSPTVDFEFIMGIGSEGPTGFENALLGKNRGDCLSLSIDCQGAAAQFEHLWNPLVQTIDTRPPFDLRIEVLEVVPATDLELVRALSQKVGSNGCGGDCTCGCGC